MAMTLRLTEADDRTVAELAARQGISKHEAVLRAIREATARQAHQHEVRVASARARVKYADLLDRLGR